jgi:hypothetical protein
VHRRQERADQKANRDVARRERQRQRRVGAGAMRCAGGGLRRPAKRLYLDSDLEKPANRPGLNRESTRKGIEMKKGGG